MATTKPNVIRIWASAADPGDITDPDTVESGKVVLGWIAEIPPKEYFNWHQNNLAQFVAHVNEFGTPEYDSTTDYPINGRALASDGLIYKSIATPNAGNQPAGGANPTKWKISERWSLEASTYTFLTGDHIVPDNSGGVWTGDAPVSPIEGDKFFIKLLAGSLAVNTVTIDGNGSDIGEAAETSILIDVEEASVQFRYDAANTIWLVI